MVINPPWLWSQAGPTNVNVPALYGLVILSKAVLVHYGMDESVEYWDVPLDRREYFGGLTGKTIAWGDEPEDCEAPSAAAKS